MAAIEPLDPTLLDPPVAVGLDFDDTRQLEPSREVLAPAELSAALRRGIALPGCHVYLSGLEEPGALERAAEMVHELRPRPTVQRDIVVLAGGPNRYPETTALPPGKGHALRKDMLAVVAGVRAGKSLEDLLAPLQRRYRAARGWLDVLGATPARPLDLARFDVAVLRSARRSRRAPVVLARHPTELELFGGLFGTRARDARPGLLHEADGGVLLVRLRDLQPGTWRRLLRGLVNGSFELLPAADKYREAPVPGGFLPQVTLAVVGSSGAYSTLFSSDGEFARLFRAKAHFEAIRSVDDGCIDEIVGWIAEVVRERGLPPVTRDGVEQLLRWASRGAGRGGRLLVQPWALADLLSEAAFEVDCIDGAAIQAALDQRMLERNHYERRVRQSLAEGFISVSTQEHAVGQANGLAVYKSGGHKFGRPLRITANIGTGRGGFVNIEREAGLSGKTHDKGIAVLTGFLRGRFARHRTLALTASLCFEQNYGKIDGDSASAAELLALLSAIGEVPLAQSRAITGSIDQKGNIQPIGSVNEKIEGFFALCNARGLTGEQGVLIPGRNAADLHLSADVVAACRAGQFHVWPVETVEDALSLLTELTVGRPEGKTWPKDTVYGRIARKLSELEATVRKAAKGPGQKKTDDKPTSQSQAEAGK